MNTARSDNLAKWARHFTSEEDANLWVRRVRFHDTVLVLEQGARGAGSGRSSVKEEDASMLL